MTNLPIMSVSGIRGKFNETLTESFVTSIAYIQTKLSGSGKIVVGRDTRPSGERLAKAIFRGIRAAGGTPIDIGIASTPTTCVAVPALNASAGIIITASHNPHPYNGYKMVHKNGRLYKGFECDQIYDAFKNKEFLSDKEYSAFQDTAAEVVDAQKIHIDKILSAIDVELVKKSKIKIAIDSINGAAGAIFPMILEKLGVNWLGVNNKLDGDFVHNPEPRPEFLEGLSNLLEQHTDFWGGFVFDPDADRLATMGEHGEPISEEMTVVLTFDNLLGRKLSPIAVNMSTSMVVEDVAKKYNVKVIRSKIGEANVVEAMEKNSCLYGGEGNGGCIYPQVSTVRDGLLAMALIIELMAKRKKKLTELVSEWPTYPIVKEKIPCDNGNPSVIINKIQQIFSNEKIDTTDGLKIIRSYGWVHLRGSNTEPIIRCYAEAVSESQARELADMILMAVKKL